MVGGGGGGGEMHGKAVVKLKRMLVVCLKSLDQPLHTYLLKSSRPRYGLKLPL